MNFKVSIEQAIQQLKGETVNRFTKLLQHGSMVVEYYAPVRTDPQMPHRQDELYIIASGSGIFNRAGVSSPCKTGDVLFVPATMEHRFEQFTEDFATWVVFYGPEGGESRD